MRSPNNTIGYIARDIHKALVNKAAKTGKEISEIIENKSGSDIENQSRIILEEKIFIYYSKRTEFQE